jgi:hypothetical protein
MTQHNPLAHLSPQPNPAAAATATATVAAAAAAAACIIDRGRHQVPKPCLASHQLPRARQLLLASLTAFTLHPPARLMRRGSDVSMTYARLCHETSGSRRGAVAPSKPLSHQTDTVCGSGTVDASPRACTAPVRHPLPSAGSTFC